MSFGLEHGDFVNASGDESQRRRICHKLSGVVAAAVTVYGCCGVYVVGVWQLNEALDGAVNAGDVDGEFTVDEDPNVVVTIEGEFFAALIGEPIANLGGEVKVVSVVAGLFAEGTVTGVCGIVEEESVEGEEAGVEELEGSGLAVYGLQFEFGD